MAWYDVNQIQRYEGLLNRHGFSFRSFSSTLDFGCGQGRHLPYIASLAPGTRLYGCDVDNFALGEARQAYPKVQFLTSGTTPPLDYADEHFDFIFSFSVFTSLSQNVHDLWLKELAAKLKPGGVMIHTTHSYEYIRRAATFSPESLLKYKLPQPVEKFIELNTGYYFVPYSDSSPDYGLAIISAEFVASRWPAISGLTMIDYVAGAIEAHPEGCHDMVMLRKNP